MTPKQFVPVQAIIFDLDGLMVDSEVLAKNAWRAVLRRYNQELDNATVHDLLGLCLRDSSRLVRERFQLPVTAEQLAAEKDNLLLSRVSRYLRPMPGLSNMLDAVDDRSLLRAVATSSRSNYATLALETIGVNGFEAIVTADLVQAGKPAPDIYLLAAEMLALPTRACIALEDSPNGIQAARSAGMRCVAVRSAMTASTDLGAANWIYPSLRDVASDLDGLIEGRPGTDS
jgi:HAD superfamily hydrolase (TIGR01509 family)